MVLTIPTNGGLEVKGYTDHDAFTRYDSLKGVIAVINDLTIKANSWLILHHGLVFKPVKTLDGWVIEVRQGDWGIGFL